ncbi:hypothetical protein HU200_039509 [Digitaria exilis]|uniref:Uncharacterized protein n=1 Tax=Digitaria exilis TaxID=1010633 RepID=A0A835BA84_9POAL|nr:hypothetical protein HU200_039509 [Digitaria exilis]CAB3452810.1 unnamed protein product [Digitaria exilis]
MILGIVAALLEEYTAAVARAVERLLSAAAPRRILPRRVRFLVLRSLPFAAPPAAARPPPHAVVLAG